jgi:hypothetical protein
MLGKKALEEMATVASPDTILAWNRKFADHKVDTSELRKSVGRPRVDQEIEALVVRMAHGARLHGNESLLQLLQVGEYTLRQASNRYEGSAHVAYPG